MEKRIPMDFSVDFIEEVKPLTPTLSLARCRIFYKGLNRNGSYITDQFAEKLIQSLPYTPIKGNYDGETADYGGHRYGSPRGQVYGVVPGEDKINFVWEKHLDDDGIEREYATCNVILYTAIFDEAKKIPEKAQSMELYPPSIKGDWSSDFSGQEAFVFEDGCFLGLQILGDEVEPCFEGAGFYALQDLKKDFSLILNEIKDFEKYIDEEGEELMPKYSIPEEKREIFEKLWETLNINFSEEKEYLVDYNICTINDNSAVVYDLANQNFNSISWEIAEDGTYSFGEPSVFEYTELTEDLKTIRDTNEGTFEGLGEKFSTMESKISEYESTITTLTTERDNFERQLHEKEEAFSTLETENESLKLYKENAEKSQKEAIVEKYENKLSEEQITLFKEKIETYSTIELEKELAFAFVKENENLFSEEEKDPPLEYKPQNDEYSEILSKYEKNLNK